jgi:hypothetical protein
MAENETMRFMGFLKSTALGMCGQPCSRGDSAAALFMTAAVNVYTVALKLRMLSRAQVLDAIAAFRAAGARSLARLRDAGDATAVAALETFGAGFDALQSQALVLPSAADNVFDATTARDVYAGAPFSRDTVTVASVAGLLAQMYGLIPPGQFRAQVVALQTASTAV